MLESWILQLVFIGHFSFNDLINSGFCYLAELHPLFSDLAYQPLDYWSALDFYPINWIIMYSASKGVSISSGLLCLSTISSVKITLKRLWKRLTWRFVYTFSFFSQVSVIEKYTLKSERCVWVCIKVKMYSCLTFYIVIF